MAEEVTSLRLSIDSREVKTAQKDLDKLSSSANNSEKSTKSLTLGFGALSTVIAGVSIGVLAKEFIQMADSITNVNNQLKLVTNTSQELATAQRELFAIAQRTRQDYSATAQTFSSFALAMGEMGKTQKEILRVTESVNKAITISGGTAQEAAAATTQLGQAFASGVLRGDELNSILENSKGLAQAIADGMGVPIGKLRTLGSEGKITSEILAQALEKSAKSIDEKFGKTASTVEQSMTVAKNSLTNMIGEMDKAVGASSAFGSGLKGLSSILDSATESLHKFNIEIQRLQDVRKIKSFEDANTALMQIDGEIKALTSSTNLTDRATRALKSQSQIQYELNQLYAAKAELNKKVIVMAEAETKAEEKLSKAKNRSADETKEQKKAREKAEREAKKLAKQALEDRKSELEGYAELEAQQALDEYNTRVGYLESYADLEAKTAIDNFEKQKEITKSIGDINAEASLSYNEQQLRQIEEEKKARIEAGYSVADAEEEAQAKIRRLQRQNSIELISGMDVAKNAVMGLENALVDAFVNGKISADAMFKAIASDLARLAIRQAITAPLFGAIAGAFGGGTAPVASANGNAFSGGKVQAFADGGAFTNSIVSKPTSAPMALFGEAGPEAIMPLQRTSDGKLGVVASGVPSQNIKIELVNQSGQELQTTQSQQKFDGEQWVIGVVIDAAKRNRSGMRDILKGNG